MCVDALADGTALIVKHRDSADMPSKYDQGKPTFRLLQIVDTTFLTP